eukprot:764189-Hanusia_phi.AAC.1
MFRISCESGAGEGDLMLVTWSALLNLESPLQRSCRSIIARLRKSKGYSVFTWGDLKKEIPFSSEIVVVSIPGKVLADAIQFSRKRAYFDVPEDWGGFMQLDNVRKNYPPDPPPASPPFTFTLISVLCLTHLPPLPSPCFSLCSPPAAPLACDDVDIRASCGTRRPEASRTSTHNRWIRTRSTVRPAGHEQESALDGLVQCKPEAGFRLRRELKAGRPAKDIIIDCCAKIILSQLGAFHDLDLDADGQLSPEEVKTAMQMRLKVCSYILFLLPDMFILRSVCTFSHPLTLLSLTLPSSHSSLPHSPILSHSPTFPRYSTSYTCCGDAIFYFFYPLLLSD